MDRKNRNTSRAFTLIELLVVIAIIAILVSILMLSHTSMTGTNAENDALLGAIRDVYLAAAGYIGRHAEQRAIRGLEPGHAGPCDPENIGAGRGKMKITGIETFTVDLHKAAGRNIVDTSRDRDRILPCPTNMMAERFFP